MTARGGPGLGGAIAGSLSVWSTLARAVAPVSIGLGYGAWGGYRPILVGLAVLSAVAVLSAGRALSADAVLASSASPRA